MPKRFKVLACKMFYREISLLTYNSPNIIDVTYLRQGYHNTPDLLRKLLQDNIDALDNGDDVYSYNRESNKTGDFDAILLAYGLCSNSITGLTSKRYPIVVPRSHDCATHLLGSKESYKACFDNLKGGAYWYSGGWIDNTLMPGTDRINFMREQYAQKYGEDNADYLMEMEQNWLKEYHHCAFIDWPELDNTPYIEFTKKCAHDLGWEFHILKGSSFLMRDFLDGNWNENDFLVVPPEKELIASFDDTILTYR